MNLLDLSDIELLHLRDLLRKDLQRLKASKKNLNQTIRNITDEMRAYRIKHQILIENPGEPPRA